MHTCMKYLLGAAGVAAASAFTASLAPMTGPASVGVRGKAVSARSSVRSSARGYVGPVMMASRQVSNNTLRASLPNNVHDHHIGLLWLCARVSILPD